MVETARLERPRLSRGTVDLREELVGAVKRDDFALEYQPLIDLQNGSIAAVEALLRWRHPLLGTIPVADYLPIAEETGLIVPIGERVLDEACRQLRTWHLGFSRLPSLSVSINISLRQLGEPGFVKGVAAALDRWEILAEWLTLELSPGCGTLVGPATALAHLGVSLVLDDFGAGDTLLDLRVLPITGVKLHAAFVTAAAGPVEEGVFAEALLAIAQARRVTTMGKGVETRAQARRLANLGCDLAQGYLYSKPLGPEGIGTLLSRGVSAGGARALG
ncbi:MAG: EAL domain-containing protein [Chloroflexi bacterium]|nr:EAL domain-containing protein [Chloroflexota bacterium]